MTPPSDEFLLRRSAQMMKADPKAARAAFAAAAVAAGPCRNCGKSHRTLTYEECLDRTMTEQTLQSRVRGRAKRAGWTVAHAGRGYVGEGGGWITPMLGGWPDFFLLNPNGRSYKVFWMEFKREKGVVEPAQAALHLMLIRCGLLGAVIRPSDLREGRVKALLEGR